MWQQPKTDWKNKDILRDYDLNRIENNIAHLAATQPENSGTPGKDGVNGRDGIDGRDGRDGKDGLRGEMGLQGPPGPQGPQGEKGAEGLQGERGVPGVEGTQGLRGVQGPQGAEGPQGPQGIQGEKGDTGLQGIEGPEGPAGPHGGPPGPQGPQGPRGFVGPPGINGVDGKDAPQPITEFKKFYVICVAGQSNAVGYDESIPNLLDGYRNTNPNRIKQLGLYGADNLQLVNLGHCAQNMQDMRNFGCNRLGTGGIHLPLANLILNEIPEDYGIIVLPIAFGGTGFTSGNNGTYDAVSKKPTVLEALSWKIESAYFKTLVDRIKHVLDLNPENKFIGTIWCQGERDSANATEHFSQFQRMTTEYFKQLNDAGLGIRTKTGTFSKANWYNLETVNYWKGVEQCATIWGNYNTWNPTTYIPVPHNRDLDSNITRGVIPCNTSSMIPLPNGAGSSMPVNSTTATLGSHYGNGAFHRLVAPSAFMTIKRNNGI